MLKTLLKKQMAEIFRSWFVNRKTGKGRSKAGTVGLALLFLVLFAYIIGIFLFMDYGLGTALFGTEVQWLYFALTGFLAILFGTLGSVFNTYAGLYLAKDNDLLIAMPIPPRTLLASRLLGVYLMSQLYSGAIWLPAIVCWWIFGSPTALSVACGLVLFFAIGLFVTVLTCLLGWLVALIAGKLKNRSFVIVLISLVLVGGYYYLSFHFYEIMQSFLQHSDAVSSWVQTWANLLYQLGHAAEGSVPALLIFTGVTLALCAAGVFILSKTFLWLATRSGGGKKAVYREQAARQSGADRALLSRELRHFTSSAVYMLNMGLGIVLLPAIGILALVNRGRLDELQLFLAVSFPRLLPYLPLLISALVLSVLSINAISTPSVSLEGRSLWLLRSLPVSGRQVLRAKLRLHVLLNLLPVLTTPVLLGLALRLDWPYLLLLPALGLVFVWLLGSLGLRFGVKRPNFNWTSETMPIKQSVNALLVFLLGWAVTISIPGIYFLLGLAAQVLLPPALYLSVWLVLLGALGALSQRWLYTKGAAIFEAL